MYPSPPPRPDPFVRRLASVTLAVIGLMLLWWSLPMIESLFAPRDGGIRTVIARGDLAADELATIELFEKSAIQLYLSQRLGSHVISGRATCLLFPEEQVQALFGMI